jgi:anaerobic glycerol-3-phosphate dehydrogenase
MDTERFDNIIVVGGLAGITTTIELLDNNKEVRLSSNNHHFFNSFMPHGNTV